MFGYVRPLRGELKVREFEAYKAAYCGLCHALKGSFGFAARFCVNYDLTFLAMLLSKEAPAFSQRRCIACIHRKKNCCDKSPALERAAACSVILSWWKLADMGADGGAFDKLKAFGGRLLLRRAYKKASRALPGFAETVETRLKVLAGLEKEKCESLDLPADEFARLLCAAAPEESGERGRILSQLLYHIGRWVYIVDAADDLEEDIASGAYNPIILRFGLQGRSLDGEEKAWIEATLKHSANLAAAAMELLEDNSWSPVLRNIVYLGLPAVTEQVLAGTFDPKKEKKAR